MTFFGFLQGKRTPKRRARKSGPWGKYRRPLLVRLLEDRVLPSVTPFPALQPVQPLGSLAYSVSQPGTLHDSADVAAFTIAADPGQTLAFVLQPTDATLQAHLQLFDPSHNPVPKAVADAPAAGQPVLLQTTVVATGGTYELDVSSSSLTGTDVPFKVNAFVNTAVDNLNAPHHTAATAQDISASSLPLQGTADRLAVVGIIDASADVDNYQFTLAQGQSASLALHSSDGTGNLTLYRLNGDGSSTLMTLGIPASTPSGAQTTNVDQSITDFLAPGNGTYYTAVGDTAGADYGLVVTRGSSFELQPGNADVQRRHRPQHLVPGSRSSPRPGRSHHPGVRAQRRPCPRQRPLREFCPDGRRHLPGPGQRHHPDLF